MTRRVTILTPWIQLGALLKLAGLADTGGQAKILIQAGSVEVNGTKELRRGRKILPGDRVSVQGHDPVILEVRPT